MALARLVANARELERFDGVEPGSHGYSDRTRERARGRFGRGLLGLGLDAAVAHAHDAIGGGRDVVVVRDHQDRLAARVQPAEQLEHLVAALGVERAGGLVGEQQRGLVGERPRDREPLALAARQHARRVLRLVGETEQVEQVARPRLGALARRARDHRGQRHVLEHAHAFEQVEELEHDADVAAPQDRELVFALADELLARERHLAVGRRVEAGDDVEQRRLAATRRPHHRDELVRAHREVDAAQRAYRRALGLEGLAQSPRDDDRPPTRRPASSVMM